MRLLSPGLLARLRDGTVVPRDFLWIGARRRDTGALVERGFWGDEGFTVAQVMRPDGMIVARPYAGGLGLVSISAVPLVIGLTAQPVTVDLAATEGAVLELVKEWSIRRAPVEIHRGYFNPATMRLEEPAILRFMGFADDPEFTTAEAGGQSAISISCAPHTQELLRSSERMRSNADQRRRNPTDGGFRHMDKPRRQLEWTRE